MTPLAPALPPWWACPDLLVFGALALVGGAMIVGLAIRCARDANYWEAEAHGAHIRAKTAEAMLAAECRESDRLRVLAEGLADRVTAAAMREAIEASKRADREYEACLN